MYYTLCSHLISGCLLAFLVVLVHFAKFGSLSTTWSIWECLAASGNISRYEDPPRSSLGPGRHSVCLSGLGWHGLDSARGGSMDWPVFQFPRHGGLMEALGCFRRSQGNERLGKASQAGVSLQAALTFFGFLASPPGSSCCHTRLSTSHSTWTLVLPVSAQRRRLADHVDNEKVHQVGGCLPGQSPPDVGHKTN